MKTAAAVLQEVAVKLGLTPEYECISQSGPQHQSIFEYRCTLCGQSATAIARSKKDAKQEAARAVLARLARAGHAVPAPWGQSAPPSGQSAPSWGQTAPPSGQTAANPPALSPPPDAYSYVALLKEYCEEYKLPAPEYTLIGDSGPPHLRSFTMRVAVGAHMREATASNKKAARQIAAEGIYKYLRGCLRSTHDFVEADALIRSVDKQMGRFKDERKDVPWRPPLGQRLSEYQCGLALQFTEAQRAAAMEALSSAKDAGRSPESQLEAAAAELNLKPKWDEMPANDGPPLITVELPNTSPLLVYMGRYRDAAAQHMIDYLLKTLQNPLREPIIAYLEKLEREKVPMSLE